MSDCSWWDRLTETEDLLPHQLCRGTWSLGQAKQMAGGEHCPGLVAQAEPANRRQIFCFLAPKSCFPSLDPVAWYKHERDFLWLFFFPQRQIMLLQVAMVPSFPGYPLVWSGGWGRWEEGRRSQMGKWWKPIAKIVNRADEVGRLFPQEKEQKGRVDVSWQRWWRCFTPFDVL